MSSLATARVIDLHAHVVLEETLGAAGDFGPTIGHGPGGEPWFQVGQTYRLNGVRYEGSAFMDIDLRLRRMTESGIDYQLLSPNPLTYFHFIPAPQAIAFCRIHNDAVARKIAPHRGRLGALAALPMQAPEAAAAELERSVRELGLLGAGFGTDLPLRLNDPALDAVYETATRLDVPLFIHPGPAGIDGPAGDPALRQFELDIIAGFTAQETLAVGSLVFGGVLDRHPALDICLSHGGGAVALIRGRMAKAARKRAWSPEALRPTGAFEERLRRLWADTHITHPDAYRLLADTYGENHLVFGTNFAGWDAPDQAEAHDLPAILADNARRLLRHLPG